jgi:hypothetical protein
MPTYSYEGYGNLYLDILRDKTLPDVPGDFNRDGRVDVADLAGDDDGDTRARSSRNGNNRLDRAANTSPANGIFTPSLRALTAIRAPWAPGDGIPRQPRRLVVTWRLTAA